MRKPKPLAEFAIRVENLSKQYFIGAEKSDSFRETLTTMTGLTRVKSKFLALQDVNINFHKGEVLGIVGKNGAGKSTLLKILSQITKPTSGKIEIHGRVASLLEVGTGFHPELSGRENIYLNGTILGMTRAEIQDKFDEIVAFSGISKFIDTPVKNYSSGMYVRLAFAVAAHLDPDILIIDEVLAVGDAEFQSKSLQKMKETATSGKTIIIVSHQMNLIKALCDRVIIMDQGKVTFDGAKDEGISFYLSQIHESSNNKLDHLVETFPTFEKIDITCEPKSPFCGEPIEFNIHYKLKEGFSSKCRVIIDIEDDIGELVIRLLNQHQVDYTFINGEGSISCKLDKWPITQGEYYMKLRLYSLDVNDFIFIDENGIRITVNNGPFKEGRPLPRNPGKIIIEQEWGN